MQKQNQHSYPNLEVTEIAYMSILSKTNPKTPKTIPTKSKRPKIKLISPEREEKKKSPLKSGDLKNTSVKQEGRNKKYRELRDAYMSEHKVCELCNKRHSSSLHHRALRGGLNMFRFFMALCNHCHEWVHDNTKQAKQLNLIINVHPKQDNVIEHLEQYLVDMEGISKIEELK